MDRRSVSVEAVEGRRSLSQTHGMKHSQKTLVLLETDLTSGWDLMERPDSLSICFLRVSWMGIEEMTHSQVVSKWFCTTFTNEASDV